MLGLGFEFGLGLGILACIKLRLLNTWCSLSGTMGRDRQIR